MGGIDLQVRQAVTSLRPQRRRGATRTLTERIAGASSRTKNFAVAAVAILYATFVVLALAKVGLTLSLGLALLPFAIIGGLSATNNPEALIYGSAFVAVALPADLAIGVSFLTVGRLASLAAIGYLIVTRLSRPSGFRFQRSTAPFTLVDWALIIYLAVIAWGLVTSSIEIPLALKIDALLPFLPYFAVRAVSPGVRRGVTWALLLGAGVGALSVLYETLVVHAPLFSDAATYRWKIPNAIYRPGGIYYGPPNAGTVLGACLLVSAPLWAGRNHRYRLHARVIAIVVAAAAITTFTRAPLLGVVIGLLLLLLGGASATQFARRAGVITAVLLTLVIVILPSFNQSQFYQQALVRPGDYAARQSYWKQALPIVFTSTDTLVFGHGPELIETSRVDVTTPVPADIGSVPLITTIGVHNQFLFTALELGLLGLIPLVVWLGGLLALSVFRARRSPRASRMAMLGLGGGILVLLADMWANEAHTPTVILPLALIAGLARSSVNDSQRGR